VSFGKVTLGFFGLFLLIHPFAHLEHLICETLESVAVPGLVLSLGVKMQMRSRKPYNSPSLGQYSLLRHDRSTKLMEQSTFLFLSWPLDELGWSVLPNSFSFFYSLVSRVASSARAYLLVMANIVSDILGLFMVSLWIRDESLLEEHNNRLIVDLQGHISLLAESLDELPEGLSLLLDDAG
jgi:hypothetical protein